MAGGIKIDLLTDTSQLKKGFATAEDALADVSDSLDDVAKDGEKATERLEDSFADLAQNTKREARKMGDDISKSYDTAQKDSSEAMETLKNDGVSNAEQVASSFDGSAESIVDGFQSAASTAFSGFGPAGAAAGLAAAAGLGVISAQLQKQKEEAEEAEQAMWDMAQGAVDSGLYTITELQKQELLKEWIGDEAKREEAEKFVERFGGTISDYLAAQLGLGDKRQEAEERILNYYADQKRALEESLIPHEARQQGLEDIAGLQEKALTDLYEEQEAIDKANEYAQEVLQTFKDTGIEIMMWKEPTLEMQAEVERLAAMDATPQFSLDDPLKQAQRIYDVLYSASKIKLPTTRTIR